MHHNIHRSLGNYSCASSKHTSTKKSSHMNQFQLQKDDHKKRRTFLEWYAQCKTCLSSKTTLFLADNTTLEGRWFPPTRLSQSSCLHHSTVKNERGKWRDEERSSDFSLEAKIVEDVWSTLLLPPTQCTQQQDTDLYNKSIHISTTFYM